jgi:hypothetical protein
MNRTTLLAALGTTLISTAAFAVTQTVNLDMHGAHLRGSERIPLKRMMSRQLGPRAVQGFALKKVEVLAKSKHGNAQISVVVGRSESLQQTIPGTPEGFDSLRSGYTKMTLQAPRSHRGQNQARKMQLMIDGNVKVDDIKLTLKKTLNYDYTNTSRLSLQKVKEFKADKVIGSTKTINLNRSIKGIVLVGTSGKVKVTKVEVTFMDGQMVILDELEGKLKSGRTLGMTLKRGLQKPVRKIKVSATSTKLFGSRGKLAVNIGQ